MKNRKLFSFFGAFVTLAMGTSAVKSYAIDSNVPCMDANVQLTLEETTVDLTDSIANGEITIDEAVDELYKTLLEVAVTDTTSNSDFVAYNLYQGNMAHTSRHIAYLTTTSFTSSPSFNVIFNMNQNIDNNGATVQSNYHTFYNNITATPLGEVPELATYLTHAYKVNISISGNLSANKCLFYYSFSPNANFANIITNSDLNASTGAETIYTIATPSYSSVPLKKCIFAKGDVDRNGIINSFDSLQVMKYSAGLLQGNALDEEAFRLAADCNNDGQINSSDVELINKYILGKLSTL